MLAALRIAVSGLNTEARAVAVAADNVANLRTTTEVAKVREKVPDELPDEGAADGETNVYRPFRLGRDSLASGGVRAYERAAEPLHVEAYDPANPLADKDGVVALPNVRLEGEFVDLITAHRAYQANLVSVRTASSMLGDLLNARI